MNGNNQHYKKIISEQVARSENLLWWGKPKEGTITDEFDSFYVIAAVLPILIISNYSLPFAIGISILVITLRLFHNYKTHKNTLYGLTDNHLIFVSISPHRNKVKSIKLDSLGSIKLKEYKDDYGVIYFRDSDNPHYHLLKIVNWYIDYRIPNLRNISNVKHVYELLTGAQNKLKNI